MVTLNKNEACKKVILAFYVLHRDVCTRACPPSRDRKIREPYPSTDVALDMTCVRNDRHQCSTAHGRRSGSRTRRQTQHFGAPHEFRTARRAIDCISPSEVGRELHAALSKRGSPYPWQRVCGVGAQTCCRTITRAQISWRMLKKSGDVLCATIRPGQPAISPLRSV